MENLSIPTRALYKTLLYCPNSMLMVQGSREEFPFFNFSLVLSLQN